MSQAIQNLRGTRNLRVAAPFLPAVVLPLALAGVTVPVTTGLGGAAEALARVEERAARVAEAERRIAAFGELTQLDEIRRAIALLRDLVPEPVADLELFNRVRFLGEQLRLTLSRCDIGITSDLGLVVDGESVFARELSLAGSAPLGALVELLAQLRAQGLPVAVLDASLSRSAPGEREFQFTTRLAVLHRAPAPVSTTSTLESSPEANVPTR